MQKIKHFYTHAQSITKIAIRYLKERPKSQLLIISIAFAMLILLALTSLVSSHTNNKNNKIAIVDTHKIISDFTNSISDNSHITDHQKIALVKHFGAIYPKLLEKYANSHHALILDKAVILQAPSNMSDITVLIEKAVAKNSVQYLKTPLIKNNAANLSSNMDESDDTQSN